MAGFFAMGGYAAFIWPAYAIALGGLLVLAIVSWQAMRSAETRAQAIGAARREMRARLQQDSET